MDAAAMRQALVRLGFTADAAQQAVNNEGIDSVETLETLGDEDVKNLCLTLRRPGGEVVNPQAGLPGQPLMIRNDGVVRRVHSLLPWKSR